MEDNEHNYDTQTVILDSSGDNSSHVVLTNITPTKNNLRRRTNTRISQPGKIKQRTSQLTTRPPKRIPQWLWILIAKSLGIKSHPKEKPYLSSFLHLLTLGSAILMFVNQVLFIGYDIASEMTKTDIIDGTTVIIIELLFIGLGIYAHRLAYRLFVHPKFLDMMRLHAKTVFKLNAGAVVFVILTTFVLVLNINTVNFMYFEMVTSGPKGNNQTGAQDDSHTNTPQNSSSPLNPCQTVNIPLTICHVYFLSQAIFSFFFLVWNGVVAVVLVSVARTHTLNIRKFICQLECDAYILDQTFRKMFYDDNSVDSKDSLKEYVWMDSDHLADVMRTYDDHHEAEEEGAKSNNVSRNGQTRDEDRDLQNIEIKEEIDDAEPTFYNDATKIELQLNESPVALGNNEEGSEDNTNSTGQNKNRKHLSQRTMSSSVFGRFQRLSESFDGGNDANGNVDEDPIEPHVMPEEEIMHKYWKIATSTRLTSQAFQRWMTIMITAIMFWSIMLIVKWLTKNATVSGVLSFIFPLLMLPLLASSYAEVNYEGLRVLQSIMPKEDRTAMFRYLYGLPIQLTAYGHPISYKTMGTVLIAILAAFVSKILLKSMNFLVNQ